MKEATFDGWYHRPARRIQFEAARAVAQQGHGWLTLWGPYGQGKTYLLAAIVNHMLIDNRPAVYVQAGKLLDHLRDAYGPGAVGYSAAFDFWADCQILAIDEADSFHHTDWAMDKYRQLLDYRYNLACAEDSITVLACNPQPGGDDWPTELSWLYSRMAHFPIIEAEGGDIRPALRGS